MSGESVKCEELEVMKQPAFLVCGPPEYDPNQGPNTGGQEMRKTMLETTVVQRPSLWPRADWAMLRVTKSRWPTL